MRINRMWPIAALAVIGARADQAPPVTGWTQTVYIDSGAWMPSPELALAEITASRMFAAADVRIDWRRGSPPVEQLEREGAILVRFTINAPDNFKPGALAFALPFERFHITVMLNRLPSNSARSSLRPMLLAHVLVHEITHMLQGCGQHSQTGVMTPRWTSADFARMTMKPLPFTDFDLTLIQTGLRLRERARP